MVALSTCFPSGQPPRSSHDRHAKALEFTVRASAYRFEDVFYTTEALVLIDKEASRRLP
jgi:hypothetical protein